ncbi:MAG: hypothetical protein CFE23_09325 [Flavobacterium sp. BFFFF1]|uniref:hypothetical protein n=1 Tax=Flavobacterium sp. BFFFF1 TaxID=2015557 RepID=UPI000BD03172|nr:hypothetical protein [Flavobacterium sp. BFFFF1]OYU80447.1 MAG: hypothetical protein CFE23_09325 [Flavobacterium sp. BFFFF1]
MDAKIKALLQEIVEEISSTTTNQIKEELRCEMQSSKDDFQPHELLTSKEVCEYYRVSIRTLDRKTTKGLKFRQSATKSKRLFRKSDCDNFFKTRNHGR